MKSFILLAVVLVALVESLPIEKDVAEYYPVEIVRVARSPYNGGFDHIGGPHPGHGHNHGGRGHHHGGGNHGGSFSNSQSSSSSSSGSFGNGGSFSKSESHSSSQSGSRGYGR